MTPGKVTVAAPNMPLRSVFVKDFGAAREEVIQAQDDGVPVLIEGIQETFMFVSARLVKRCIFTFERS